jgi:ribonuclease T
MTTHQNDFFISVDVETAGPSPNQYSLLSIGACTIVDPQQTLYIELKPVNQMMDHQAQAIHGLSLPTLFEEGMKPEVAMERFATWLTEVTPNDSRPVFVAFNAPFDWMFICDYFYRYLGRNPFGHSALDVKSLFMGISKTSWSNTSLNEVSRQVLDGRSINHNALEDAMIQGEIFRRLLSEM